MAFFHQHHTHRIALKLKKYSWLISFVWSMRLFDWMPYVRNYFPIQTFNKNIRVFYNYFIILLLMNSTLYFVLSRERLWRHWARPRIHAASILYASIPVFLFERVRKQKLRARWQASSSGIRTDVTVILGVRQSIHQIGTSLHTTPVKVLCGNW